MSDVEFGGMRARTVGSPPLPRPGDARDGNQGLARRDAPNGGTVSSGTTPTATRTLDGNAPAAEGAMRPTGPTSPGDTGEKRFRVQ